MLLITIKKITGFGPLAIYFTKEDLKKHYNLNQAVIFHNVDLLTQILQIYEHQIKNITSIGYFLDTTKEERFYSWKYDIFNNATDKQNLIAILNITLNYDPVLGLLKELWLNIGGSAHTDTSYIVIKNNSSSVDTYLATKVIGLILVIIPLIIHYKKRKGLR